MNSNPFGDFPVPLTASPSKARTWIVPSLLGLFIAAGLYVSGCKKDEAPPPLPSATASEEAPAPALTLAPEEDAGSDADADAATPKGPFRPAQSLKNCCAALRQNAASAPPPTNGYMLAAAAACDGMSASNVDRGSAIAQIQAALKGAGMPAACY